MANFKPPRNGASLGSYSNKFIESTWRDWCLFTKAKGGSGYLIFTHLNDWLVKLP